MVAQKKKYSHHKIILILLIISFNGVQLRAQSKILSKIEEIGITGGPGVVSLRGNEIYDGGHHFLIEQNFGLNIKINGFKKRFRLDTKFLVEQLGSINQNTIWQWDDNNLNLETGIRTSTIKLDYFTLPIGMQYYFSEKMNWCASAGMFIGFFRKGNLLIEERFLSSSTRYNYIIERNSADYNGGASLGIGYRKQFAHKYFVYLELNDKLGFSNVSHQDPNLPTSTIARTNALNLSVSFSMLTHRK